MTKCNERSRIYFDLIDRITAIIDIENRPITNRELLELCSVSGVESLSANPHLFHEIAETALNHLIKKKYGEQLLFSTNPSASCSEILKPLLKRLPTQSWRSDSQITYQQFSTPASIAYLAAYLLNLTESDTVLEPSCGTGSLAVWALAAGAVVVTNEIDPGRQMLSALAGLVPTGYDAEFIDDFLFEGVIPSVILANPPFSSSGGRVARNQNKFGFRHVESALRRLAPGGRFAIILGEAGAPRNVSGRRFWQSLLPNIRVTATIELPGSEYYRYGTTVRVTLLLGHKTFNEKPASSAAFGDRIDISATSVEDAFDQSIAKGLRFEPTTE
ncbi:MAG: hypothetical protein ABI999_17330 [Acidobacteriota bacterium]